MSKFTTSVDVANRGLQHCGAARITSFADDSKNADEVNFCYDKLRVAELRRNVWRFAIRRTAIRPIDTDTKLFAPAAWSNVAAYVLGQVVSYAGALWEAKAGSTGITPDQDTASWEVYCGPMTVSLHDATVEYFSGELVYIATAVYRSLSSQNDTTPPGSTWVSMGTFSADLDILYPIDAGPTSENGSRNVYRAPNGFLRHAPDDPKAGSSSWLGAPSGSQYRDWNWEGDYIVTSDSDPIVLRFVADVTTVTAMDPMFCEGLGARIGLEVCEALTQSTTKLSTIGAAYNRFMSEARIVNGIETGATEPPVDDYIACRV